MSQKIGQIVLSLPNIFGLKYQNQLYKNGIILMAVIGCCRKHEISAI